jgi:hypothetical protein
MTQSIFGILDNDKASLLLVRYYIDMLLIRKGIRLLICYSF